MEVAQKSLEENYSGSYNSHADYVEGLTTETIEVPGYLAFYIVMKDGA